MRPSPSAILVALVLLAGARSGTAEARGLFGHSRPEGGARAGTVDPLGTQCWRTGRGAPSATIVFLHGLGCTPRDPLIQRLVRELDHRGDSFLVVAPWLRPASLNRRGELISSGTQTMSDQLRRARQLLDQQDGPVVLLGHSFGGKAALELAREYPDKVACVVGLAPSVNMLYSYWKRLTGERGLPDDRGVIHRRLDAYRGELRRQLGAARGLEAMQLRGELDYLAVMKDLVSFDEARVERGLERPTLVLHGTDDQAVSIHYARRLAEANPGVRLVEIPEVGHGFAERASVDGSRGPVIRQLAGEISEFIDAHQGGR